MSVPAWLLDIFAAVMLLVAAVSAARLAISRRLRDPDADIDLSHLLMGVAMAGTLVASLSTLPSAAWEVIFGALTLWFAHRVTGDYRSGRRLRALVTEHHAPHLLHSAAMLYMFLALRPLASHAAPAGAMPGMGAATLRLPTLALLFAFLLCAYVVADLDRVPPPPALARPHLATPAPAPSMALAGASTITIPATTSAPMSPPTTPAPPTKEPLVASPAPAASGLSGLLSPGVARGGRIAMGVTMAFMLIIMI